MTLARSYLFIRILIALVWLANGLLCKILNLVPRHTTIVGTILGDAYAREITIAIGIAETGMTIWILSGLFRKFNAVFQMMIIAAMNILESILTPHLLLWGRWNALFAGLFILLIYYNEFKISPASKTPQP